MKEACELMSGTRDAKPGIFPWTSATVDEMTHWRTPKHRTIKHYGGDYRSGRAQTRWNLWPLAALLLNALLWAAIYWIVAAFL
ncbi:hypothetical protein [Bradyrhizobium vignae]|uniref:hypothetical protein n=1 Tax=Bradyrhizobium vignae TaxID=1549949 RepID=UPI000F00585F|nr:hypothetical protein [Bradyrhizobium vignae]